MMFGEHSSHHVFIDLQAKDSGNQQCNLRATIPRVPPFCFDNGADELFGGALRPGFFFLGMKAAAGIWPLRAFCEGARASIISRLLRFGQGG